MYVCVCVCVCLFVYIYMWCVGVGVLIVVRFLNGKMSQSFIMHVNTFFR